ncbi:MAG: tetratricopeptide repeat protein [Lachnospiraceae bacterium]|nr:tetratricopeptide repeat protein [Lachnospiraceae bacterium]
MNKKRKVLTFILVIEAIIIIVIAAFLVICMNSNTAKIKKQMELAQNYLLAEEYDEAIAAFEEVINLEPKMVEAYIGLAEAYTQSGDLEKAAKILKKGYKRTDSEELKEQLDELEEKLAEMEAQTEETTDTDTEAAAVTTTVAEDFYAQEAITEQDTTSADAAVAGDDDWKQAYIDYLQYDSESEYMDGYNLIYLDDDDIPELVEVGNCEAAGCRIVNYSNGTVYVTQLSRLYFSYIERKNLLCNSGGHMDCYYDVVFSIINGELEVVAQGSYGAEDNSNVQFDADGNPIYYYEWNGVRMTEKEYEQELSKVYDVNKSVSGYQYDNLYTVEEMIEVMENR